jgi:hypothetical protein
MSDLDALVLEAWSEPRRAKALWKVARKDPALARSAWTVEWVRKEGYAQDGRLHRNALESAALGLALHGDPRVVPFVAARAFERWDFARLLLPWLETDRVDGARLAAFARPRLADDGAGVHAWVLAARCLAAVGAPDDGALVAKRLGQCFDAMWTQDAGQIVRMEEHASALGDALLGLAIPRSFVAMLEGVASAESHTIDRARGTAAELLASLGTGVDAIARGLRFELDGGHPSRVVPGQLVALGALGKALPDEARRGLAGLVRRVLEGDQVRGALVVAAHAALTDLGADTELEAAARRCLAEVRYGWDDTVKAWSFVLELVGRREDLPATLAEPFVREDDLRLHRAAFRALRRRGAPVPETRLVDPCILHTSPPDTLREALLDARTLPRGAVAERLSETATRDDAPALLAALASLPAPRHDGDPRRATRRHLLLALARSGDASALAKIAEVLEAPGGDALAVVEALPSALARTAAHLYLRSKDKRVREQAKQWIAARTSEPEVQRALEALGLTVDDFSRRAR